MTIKERHFKTAIIMLACKDYEATELSLACHAAFAEPDVPIYVLQNCRGDYDAERTLLAIRRYRKLYPDTIRVVEHISPGSPYKSLRRLINELTNQGYNLICKVDDDAFPITRGWLKSLIQTYSVSESETGERELAYVTPLINNNTWGFKQVLDAMQLENEFFERIARVHEAGFPPRILEKDQIQTGQDGTIWGLAYVARWLHQQTTLSPERFIAATESLTCTDVPSEDRYSIGCILFEPKLWQEIDNGGSDDEHMMHMYCKQNSKRIICNRSVPFVHLAYFSQREENRDIPEQARMVYQQFLGHPYPISLCQSREIEIEGRLRWLENRTLGKTTLNQGISNPSELLHRGIRKIDKYISSAKSKLRN